jgi:hypothetical protein
MTLLLSHLLPPGGVGRVRLPEARCVPGAAAPPAGSTTAPSGVPSAPAADTAVTTTIVMQLYSAQLPAAMQCIAGTYEFDDAAGSTTAPSGVPSAPAVDKP